MLTQMVEAGELPNEPSGYHVDSADVLPFVGQESVPGLYGGTLRMQISGIVNHQRRVTAAMDRRRNAEEATWTFRNRRSCRCGA